MKRSRLSYQQIAFLLRQRGEGTGGEEVCRKAGITMRPYDVNSNRKLHISAN